MKRLFRYARIFFNRMQLASGNKLAVSLKNDILWKSLTATEHQKIGKLIAKYNNYFIKSCPYTVSVNYKYTDKFGNGIYG